MNRLKKEMKALGATEVRLVLTFSLPGAQRQPGSVSSCEGQPDLHLLSPLSVLRCPSRKCFFPNGKNLSTISYLIRGAGPRSQFTSYDSPACQSVRAPPLGLRHSLGMTLFFLNYILSLW